MIAAALARTTPRDRRLVTAALVASLVTALVATALLGWRWQSERRAEAAAWAVVAQAGDRTEQLLSYDITRLDADLARGRAQVTGDYATRYRHTVDEVIAPAARARRIATLTRVVRAGLVDAGPGWVRALLYLNQAVSSSDQASPRALSSQVLVTMSQVDGQWLISDLRPL
jgi:Mce-associated membrane protein